MSKITNRQLQCLNVINEIQEKDGYSPTIKEIGDILGLSALKGITDLLDRLEKHSCIERKSNTARSIKITAKGKRYLKESNLFPIKYQPLFGNYSIPLKTQGGTTSYQLEFPSCYIDHQKVSYFYDTEAVSLLIDNSSINFPISTGSSVILEDSILNEVNRKFPEIPSNFMKVPKQSFIKDSLTMYSSKDSNLSISWHSSTESITLQNWSQSYFKPQNLIFSQEQTDQLSLLPNTTNVENHYLYDLEILNTELKKILKFVNFPISAVLMTKNKDIYVCSQHTARKQGDFDLFKRIATEKEKKSIAVIKSDKRLLRDFDFNFLPYAKLAERS